LTRGFFAWFSEFWRFGQTDARLLRSGLRGAYLTRR
jgi:hypothetical protein